MAIDTSIPRSRRALLVGGIGGLAAVATSALGRPLPVQAGSDGDVVLGAANVSGTTTSISNAMTKHAALSAQCTFGDGVSGTTSAAGRHGVYGESTESWGYAVYGRNTASGAWGYIGRRWEAIFGRCQTGTAVMGFSGGSAVGVEGVSSTGVGVIGRSETRSGVLGASGSETAAATVGHSWSGATGVYGYSGRDLPSAPIKVGVYGLADQDTNARGVHGQTTVGRGVYGQSTTGTGVYGYASSGIAVRGYAETGTALYGSTGNAAGGYALRAIGRVRFDRCSGIATVGSGSDSVTVRADIDLSDTSAVVATLQGNAGSASTTVSRVFVNTSMNTFTIYLTANATQNVRVAWHVFG